VKANDRADGEVEEAAVRLREEETSDTVADETRGESVGQTFRALMVVTWIREPPAYSDERPEADEQHADKCHQPRETQLRSDLNE